jgi:hypothetical protein
MFFEIIPTLMFYCFFLPCTLRNNAHTCHSSSAPVVVSSNNTNTCILTRHGNTWLHPHLSISYVMGDSSSYATWDKIHPPCTGTVLDISVDTKFSKRFCTLTLISTDYYDRFYHVSAAKSVSVEYLKYRQILVTLMT